MKMKNNKTVELILSEILTQLVLFIQNKQEWSLNEFQQLINIIDTIDTMIPYEE